MSEDYSRCVNSVKRQYGKLHMRSVNRILSGVTEHAKYPLPALFERGLIGERLELVRRARGLTQTALCEALGFNTSMYNQWEKGSKIPNTPDLIRFCAYTGATTDYILYGKTEGLPFDLWRLLSALAEDRSAV